MPDLYFYREPEDIEKEEQARAEAAAKPDETYPPADWVSAPVEQTGISADWGEQPATTDVSTNYLSFASPIWNDVRAESAFPKRNQNYFTENKTLFACGRCC